MEETYPYNDEYLVKLYNRAKRYALKFVKYRRLADDFSAYAILRSMRYKKRISIEKTMLDFLRSEKLSYRADRKTDFQYVTYFNDKPKSQYDVEDYETSLYFDIVNKAVAKPYFDENYTRKFLQKCDFLTEKEKVIFLLHHDYDLDYREIGEKFGVCESRICQIIRQTKDKIINSGLAKDLIY